MTQDECILFADTRMSREARMVGLYTAAHGDGEHQISHDTFRLILGRGARGLPKDDTLAGYVQELVSHGWIERKSGGQGSPLYTFTPPPRGSIPEALTPLESFTLPPRRGNEALSPSTVGGQSALSSSRRLEVVVDEVETRARKKSEDDNLRGCRGALRDYLAGSVSPARQYQYVQTLLGWRGGTDAGVWKTPDGSSIPLEKQTALLAAALNELGASDETKYKRPVGDPANLKTKMNVILRQAHRPKGDSGSLSTGDKNDSVRPGKVDPDRWKKGAIDGSYL